MDIFVSYRRNDSADVTGRIYDRLVYSFGEKAIFKDVDSIPFGVNFKTYLGDIFEKSKILLVVIGPKWLNITNDQGERRLDDPSDFVRVEIEAALERKIIIIPLLVSGASMPAASQLPSSLEELAFYNGIQIRPDPDFHKDMDRLIHELETQVKPSGWKDVGISYPRSNLPTNQKRGNILNRSLAEIFSLVKEKVLDFINFLPTPWGRLLSGIVLGGIALIILVSILTAVFSRTCCIAIDVWDSLGITLLSCSISGLFMYPHRKSLLYVAAGIIFATTITFLIIHFAEKVSILEFTSEYWSIVAYSGLFAGTLLGAILSRIQHLRKKI